MLIKRQKYCRSIPKSGKRARHMKHTTVKRPRGWLGVIIVNLAEFRGIGIRNQSRRNKSICSNFLPPARAIT